MEDPHLQQRMVLTIGMRTLEGQQVLEEGEWDLVEVGPKGLEEEGLEEEDLVVVEEEEEGLVVVEEGEGDLDERGSVSPP